MIRLNDYINEKRISNIDILKIDTEGYEFKVLEGLNLNHKINISYLSHRQHHYIPNQTLTWPKQYNMPMDAPNRDPMTCDNKK